MKITIEYKPVEKLTKKEVEEMNYYRVKDWNESARCDFKKEDKNGIFIFVKNDGKLKAYGMLKPVKIDFRGEKYSILGMGRGRAIEKGKEYGRLLSAARIYYIKNTGKTAIAFTGTHNIGFFEKAGFRVEKDFIKRFAYKNSKTKEITYDNDGHGVCYEGKDKLISKILKTKGYAYTNVDFW